MYLIMALFSGARFSSAKPVMIEVDVVEEDEISLESDEEELEFEDSKSHHSLKKKVCRVSE